MTHCTKILDGIFLSPYKGSKYVLVYCHGTGHLINKLAPHEQALCLTGPPAAIINRAN